ncbi:MAG TPA: cytochrome c biogenesis protein CcdA [Gemmatimonadales bacterium]|nr:cytochrome c biogenesis protein CcdA [Gemmatimonadales bacterium]
MDTSLSIGFGIAFSAGLLSFLSPCVLPLVPSYVTFITGLSLDDVQRSRRTALVHALLFILGFSLIFIALGATATLLGRVLLTYREWITRIGGALVIVFGLYLLGVFNLGILTRERRVHLADKPIGYLGTVLVGIAFGAGWTPCIGPILGSILAYSTSQADVKQGVLLLGAYSLGLAVPFFLAAIAVERFLGVFGWLRKHMGTVNRIAGILLIVVGILMVTDYFTIMASKLQSLTPEAIRSRI